MPKDTVLACYLIVILENRGFFTFFRVHPGRGPNPQMAQTIITLFRYLNSKTTYLQSKVLKFPRILYTYFKREGEEEFFDFPVPFHGRPVKFQAIPNV